MSQNKSLYQLLKTYTPAQKRDAWANLGNNVITTDSKAFVKDMIYFVNVPLINNSPAPNTPASALNGYLLLCIEPLLIDEGLPWRDVVINNETLGYISFATNIVSPNFNIIANPTEMANVVAVPIDPHFLPYENTNITEIQIEDDELSRILLETGVPFLSLDDLEYPREKLLELMIKPAMLEYFKYFPIVRVQAYPVNTIAATNGQFRIEFPTWAYGVVRAFLNQGMPGTVNSHYWGYFFNELAGYSRFGGVAGMGTGSKGGKPYFSNTEGQSTFMLQRAASQGILNYYTRIYTKIDRDDDGKKWVMGHINKFGTIEIHFAHYIWDWDAIDENRILEVRKLATANVLRALGSLRGLVKSDIPGTLDYASMLARATELEKEVLDFWKSIPKPVFIRGEG